MKEIPKVGIYKTKTSTVINILFILMLGFRFIPLIIKVFDTHHIPGITFNLVRMQFVFLLLHGFILFYYPQLFIKKTMLLIYFYYLLFFFFRVSGYYDTSSQWFGAYHFSIYIAVLTYTYYFERRDYKGLGLVALSSVIFILLKGLLNIVQLIRYPGAVRGVSGGLAAQGYQDLQEYYRTIGVAGYEFATSVIILFPVMLWLYKYASISTKMKKYSLFWLIVIAISVFMSAYTAPIIIGVISLVLAYQGRKNLKHSITIILIIILPLIFLFYSYLPNIFYGTSKLITNKAIASRLNDVGLALEYGVDVNSPRTIVDYRAQRIPINFNQFLENPIFGKGKEGNAHLFWLNYLAQFGIVGTFVLILILIEQVKINLRNISNNFKFYYLLAVMTFIIMGLVKAYPKTYIFEITLFVVPSIYYIPYLNKKKQL